MIYNTKRTKEYIKEHLMFKYQLPALHKLYAKINIFKLNCTLEEKILAEKRYQNLYLNSAPEEKQKFFEMFQTLKDEIEDKARNRN